MEPAGNDGDVWRAFPQAAAGVASRTYSRYFRAAVCAGQHYSGNRS